MIQIEIQIDSEGLRVRTPYHPEFPERARAIGGRWDPASRVWRFDPRDEARVRAILTDIFGTDGTDRPPLVIVRIRVDRIPGIRTKGSLWLFGREIARRPGRDDRVRLGPGVILIDGGFPPRGGSRSDPRLSPEEGTVLEVRDVPRPLVERHRGEPWLIEVLEETAPVPPPGPAQSSPPADPESAPEIGPTRYVGPSNPE